MIKKKYSVGIVLSLFSLSMFANPLLPTPTQLLNEQSLLTVHRAKSLSNQRNEALLQAENLNASLLREDYQANLKTQINVKKSNEQAISQFQPVFSPYQDWSVGIEQKLPVGLTLGVGVFGSQFSTTDGTIEDSTQIGASVSAKIDLWKNIFGRLDRAKLQSAEARKIRAQFQNEINKKVSEVQLRKTFWSFVAVSQSKDLTERLIASAERQLKDARARSQAGVSDRGEVARYQSQVESRNSSLLLFQYESDLTTQFLEREIEGFRISEWKLDPNFDKFSQPLVEQCIATVGSKIDLDLKTTLYDELLGTLIAEQDSELRIAGKHGDIDLSVVGQFQTTGVANTFERARDLASEENLNGSAVGLQLTIPIGGDSRRSEISLVAAKKLSLESQKLGLINEIRTTHETLLKSVMLLTAGLKRQVENSKNLDISYREMERKYRQGRVPVSTLVLEQDSLFNSQLQEIALKKQIAHVLLDYFSVFNEFPCQWNRI